MGSYTSSYKGTEIDALLDKMAAENLPTLTTDEKGSLVGAINEVNGKALGNADSVGLPNYTEQNYITDAESVTASLDALDMGLKDTADLVSTNVGDLETLTTTDKSSLVNATNEVKNLVDINKAESTLKVATVEKELNALQSTLSQVNVNQEAKQTATGYGIVSLPKNAANGQISAILKGNTWTNRAGIGDTSPQTIENLDSAKTYLLIKTDGGTVNVDAVDTAVPAKITGKTSTVLTWASGKIALYELSTAEAALTEAQLGARYHHVSSTKSTKSVRLRSVNEDDTKESIAYVNLPPGEELRSLPNGTKDEVNVTDGVATKGLGQKIIQESDITISTSLTNVDLARITKPADSAFYNNYLSGLSTLGTYPEYTTGTYDSVDNIGKFSTKGASTYIDIFFPKGTTLEQMQTELAGTSLTYQLAEPVVTPVQVSGNLVSHPSGTVYIEPVVADAGIYTDKMTVLQQDLPIHSIEKISKVDYATGVETELDTSTAAIAVGGLSFTHPDLVVGDIVFFTYFYDSALTTLGETNLTYYDSRYTIADTADGKFYQWAITSTNGVPSISLVEV